MRFEQLKPNFLTMEFDEQLSFITAYCEGRTRDLSQTTVVIEKKPSSKARDKQIKLNPEQLKLLKQLGLV